MLTLLSQPDGASIQEMMQATNWQQHSVRGFLAGDRSTPVSRPLLSTAQVGRVGPRTDSYTATRHNIIGRIERGLGFLGNHKSRVRIITWE
jgi:hypothetical protein